MASEKESDGDDYDCTRPGAGAGKVIETETVAMRSATGTVRWIRADHRYLAKFQPD